MFNIKNQPEWNSTWSNANGVILLEWIDPESDPKTLECLASEGNPRAYRVVRIDLASGVLIYGYYDGPYRKKGWIPNPFVCRTLVAVLMRWIIESDSYRHGVKDAAELCSRRAEYYGYECDTPHDESKKIAQHCLEVFNGLEKEILGLIE